MSTEKQIRKRKQAVIRLDIELMKEVKILAVRQEKPFNELAIEALKDLLKKYSSKK